MEIISFVVLHYKDLETTDRCVKSILQMEKQNRIRIVIVDNDISDPYEKRIKIAKRYRNISNIKVLQIMENGGFSYSNNIGYRFAREQQEASFIVVLNNDIIFPQKDFVKRLDKAYKVHFCHVLGPDVVRYGSNEHQNPLDIRIRSKKEVDCTIMMNKIGIKLYPLLYPLLYIQNKCNEKIQHRKKTSDTSFYCKVHKGIVPFGACLIFTPKFVKNEEKAFDPETRFYYEEYILALRCQKKKYDIVYDPNLWVTHESGTATKKTFGSEWKRLRFMMERTLESCEIYRDWML